MVENQEPKELEKKCDFDAIKEGDFLCETQYYRVTHVDKDEIGVRNERGYEFDIEREIVEEGMFSSSQHGEVVDVTRTELCGMLEAAGDTIFTVNFNKQPREKDINKEILDAIKHLSDPGEEKYLKKAIKEATKKAIAGEERTLIGYLVQTEPKMGRSQVIDLEAEMGRRLRLVDHRTLNWIVLKNIKYQVKKKSK